MDLFKQYLGIRQKEFGNAQVKLAAAERTHLSISSLRNGLVEIGYGQSASIKYPEKRYVLAKYLDYDMFLSVYDVNSGSVFAIRLIKKEDMEKVLSEFLKSLKRPNLELRAIGMQNLKEDYGKDIEENISLAYNFLKPNVKLVELDLFGNEVRHVAIDAKTGASIDVLIYDRFYKPGELITQTSLEQFRSIITSHATKV